eukprot:PhM_4_TR13045/c0_g1_i1/m.88325
MDELSHSSLPAFSSQPDPMFLTPSPTPPVLTMDSLLSSSTPHPLNPPPHTRPPRQRRVAHPSIDAQDMLDAHIVAYLRSRGMYGAVAACRSEGFSDNAMSRASYVKFPLDRVVNETLLSISARAPPCKRGRQSQEGGNVANGDDDGAKVKRPKATAKKSTEKKTTAKRIPKSASSMLFSQQQLVGGSTAKKPTNGGGGVTPTLGASQLDELEDEVPMTALLPRPALGLATTPPRGNGLGHSYNTPTRPPRVLDDADRDSDLSSEGEEEEGRPATTAAATSNPKSSFGVMSGAETGGQSGDMFCVVPHGRGGATGDSDLSELSIDVDGTGNNSNNNSNNNNSGSSQSANNTQQTALSPTSQQQPQPQSQSQQPACYDSDLSDLDDGDDVDVDATQPPPTNHMSTTAGCSALK